MQMLSEAQLNMTLTKSAWDRIPTHGFGYSFMAVGDDENFVLRVRRVKNILRTTGISFHVAHRILWIRRFLRNLEHGCTTNEETS